MLQVSKWPRYIPPVDTSLIASTSTGSTDATTATSYDTYFAPSLSSTGALSYSSPATYFPLTSTSVLSPPSTFLSTSSAISPSLLSTRVVIQTTGTVSLSVYNSSTTTTALQPTILASSKSSPSRLIGLAVGLTCGLIAIILVAFFAYRRHKRQTRLKTEDEALLEEGAEEISINDDGDNGEEDVQTMMRSIPTSAQGPSTVGVIALRRPGSPTPSLLKTRVSETGSIFQEDVWPPPTSPGMMDPIRMTSSQVDLSTIVDGVMGPVLSTSNATPLQDQHHRRGLSSDSSMPLLGFRHFSGSSEDYTQSPPSPASSVSHALPPSVHSDLGIDTSTQAVFTESHTRPPISPFSTTEPPLVIPLSHHPPSLSSSTTPSISPSISHLNRTQPKVSSPLARALSGFGVVGRQTPDLNSDPIST